MADGLETAGTVDVAIVSYFNPADFPGGAERIAWAAAELLDARRRVAFVSASPVVSSAPFTQYRLGGWTRRLYHQEGERRNLAVLALFHLLSLFNPFVLVEALVLFRRLRPAVVHTHNLIALSPAVWLAARLSGARVVHTHQDLWLLCERATMTDASGRLCHESQPTCRICRALRAPKKAQISLVDVEVFPSTWLRDKLGRAGPLVRNFATSVPARSEAAGGRAEPPTVVYLGGLTPHKLGALLDGFECAAAAGRPMRLAVAGSGPLAAKVAATAQSTPNVDYLGLIDAPARDRLLATASALVIPSTCPETSPLVFFEALAAGLPVIASDIGGITELARFENVVLVPPGDVGALAEALESVLGDPELSERLRAGAAKNLTEAAPSRFLEQIDPLLRG